MQGGDAAAAAALCAPERAGGPRLLWCAGSALGLSLLLLAGLALAAPLLDEAAGCDCPGPPPAAGPCPCAALADGGCAWRCAAAGGAPP